VAVDARAFVNRTNQLALVESIEANDTSLVIAENARRARLEFPEEPSLKVTRIEVAALRETIVELEAAARSHSAADLHDAKVAFLRARERVVALASASGRKRGHSNRPTSAD
jgi:hypothetical protein